jgi:hypothetical protein
VRPEGFGQFKNPNYINPRHLGLQHSALNTTLKSDLLTGKIIVLYIPNVMLLDSRRDDKRLLIEW